MREIRKKQIFFWLCVAVVISWLYYDVKYLWPAFVKWCMAQ